MRKIKALMSRNRVMPPLGVLLLALTACSTASETFDSKPGPGVGVRPISAVNALVNRGEVPGVPVDEDELPLRPPLGAVRPEGEASSLLAAQQGLLERRPETAMRLWIAPYEDEQGHFHEGAWIHAIIRPGYWQMGALSDERV